MKLAEIDRALFQALHDAAVAAGYTPDETPGTAAYDAALETMSQARQAAVAQGQVPPPLVRIFSTATADNLGAIATPCIFVLRREVLPGAHGNAAHTVFEHRPDEDRFTEYALPSLASNVQYEVRYIASTTSDERAGAETIMQGLSPMGALQGLAEDGTPTGEWFTLNHRSGVEVGNMDYFERLFRYEVQGVYIEDPRPIADVARLKRVAVDMVPDTAPAPPQKPPKPEGPQIDIHLEETGGV